MDSKGQGATRKLDWQFRKYVVAFVLLIGLTRPAAADSLTEAKVKAAYLYNFAKFVTWPPNASGGHTDSFTICTVGERPLLGMIDETVRGKSVDERPLRTRRVDPKQDLQGCQVLFIPAGQRLDARGSGSDPTSFGVLTGSEGDNSDRPDRFQSVSTLLLQEGKVRFVINAKAAEHAGLTISSRLLTLAVRI